MIQPIFFPLNVNSSSISLKNLANCWEKKRIEFTRTKLKNKMKNEKKIIFY
jgi:hypothetical protein